MTSFPQLSSWKGKLSFIKSVMGYHKSIIVMYLVFTSIIAIFNAVIPYFTKLQIDQLEQQQALLSWNLSPFGYFLLLLILPVGLELIRLHFFNRTLTFFTNEVRQRLQTSVEDFIWQKMKFFDAESKICV